MTIHEKAVVEPQAKIDGSATIGPYAVIGKNVVIGSNTIVDAHAVISGHTTIGANNHVGSFTSIGTPPQDMHYSGEATELIIGNNNQIREYVSIHRGTVNGNGKTVIGDNNLLMAYTHVAHDCIIHNHVIMANVATLAGHVELGSHVNLGGLTAIHQFCRVGDYSYIGGMSGISKDVPPFVIVTGTRKRMRISGVNKIGMKRNGVSREVVSKLEKAYKMIYRSSEETLLKDSLTEIEHRFKDCVEVQAMVEFFRTSSRGVVKNTGKDLGCD